MLDLYVHSLDETRQIQNPENLAQVLKDKTRRVWADFESPSPGESALLTDVFAFHPLAIEDCFDKKHLPKIDDYDQYLFLVIHHGATFSARLGTFSTEKLSIFISSNYLVTVHDGPSRTITLLKERLLKHHSSFTRGTDFLLHDILDGIVDHYFPVLDEFDNQIDQLEEEVFRNPTSDTSSKILLMKKNVLNLKRATAPQRELFNQLSRDDFPVISSAARIYFRDVYDHLVHIYDLTDSYQNLISGTRDAYLSTISNKLNEVMKVLTVISTIILPLSLISGIYGMNFVNIPELKDPYGYFKVMGVMAGIAIFLLIFFKRKKWI